MLLYNYVQHEICLPSVTKNYELCCFPEDGRLRPKHVGVFLNIGFNQSDCF